MNSDRARASVDSASSVQDVRVIDQLARSTLFRQYREDFEETTGLPLALRPAGSFNSPLHDSSHANPFCQLLATQNSSCAACLRLHQRLASEATAESVSGQCFAGLTESAVPIRVGDEVLGHLQTGQILLHRPTDRRFREIEQELKKMGVRVDRTRLKEAYRRTRVLTRKHYESAVRLLSTFALHLGVVANQIAVQASGAEPPAMRRARDYVEDHLDEEISLARVARACHMSEFYFCKIFKKTTGMTFTHYLARQRIERVKRDLLNPHLRVSEAAFATGFQSLSQFNRVFRRIAGESPSRYRERMLAGPASHQAA